MHFPHILRNLFYKMTSWKPKIEWKYLELSALNHLLLCLEEGRNYRQNINLLAVRIISMKSLMLVSEPGMMS